MDEYEYLTPIEGTDGLKGISLRSRRFIDFAHLSRQFPANDVNQIEKICLWDTEFFDFSLE